MNIVTADWLEENLNKNDISILDCSWHLPNTKRSGKEEFLKERIPNATFFDIDEIADQDSSFPHMMPDEDFFSKKVGELGIANNNHIITYDSLGVFSAARVYWMFKQFGHSNISILNGGLKYWKIMQKKLETTPPIKKDKANYVARLDRSRIKDFNQVQNNLGKNEFMLIDARPAGRYNGSDPEPRSELKSGNITGSINIPFGSIIDESTGCFKNKKELKNIFSNKKINKKDKVVFSCGSGVAACVVGTAYEIVNNSDNFDVYDGSWTEWAIKNNLKNT